MVNHSSNRKLLEDSDPVMAFDGRQSAIAAEIQRGVCRALRALGHSVVTELSLANGRRADVVGLSPGGRHLDRRDQILPARFSDRRQMDRVPAALRPALFRRGADFPCEVIPEEAG